MSYYDNWLIVYYDLCIIMLASYFYNDNLPTIPLTSQKLPIHSNVWPNTSITTWFSKKISDHVKKKSINRSINPTQNL